MDDIDRKILELLIEDGRASVTQVADDVNLSVSATAERIRRLTASGVIARFTIAIDPAAAGRVIEAIVEVRMSHTDTARTEAALRDQPSVIDADYLTGHFDLLLRVAVRDVAELNSLLEALKVEMGAEDTNTRIILTPIEGFPRNSLPVLTGERNGSAR